MKKLILVLLVLLIAGGGVAFYLFNKKVPTLDKAKADFVLTANELFDAFEENETEALKQYEGKVIEVTGNVDYTKENNGMWNVVLEAENAMMGGVNCSFNSNPGELSEEITVRGRCQGFLMDVILNNCYLVK